MGILSCLKERRRLKLKARFIEVGGNGIHVFTPELSNTESEEFLNLSTNVEDAVRLIS